MVIPGISAIVFAGTFTLKGQIAQIINEMFNICRLLFLSDSALRVVLIINIYCLQGVVL